MNGDVKLEILLVKTIRGKSLVGNGNQMRVDEREI